MTHLSPEALAGYLDRDLTGDERRHAELHLASCAECREELADVRRLQPRSIRQWVPIVVPVAVAAALLLAVALPRNSSRASDVRAGPGAESQLAIVSPAPSEQIAPGTISFTWRSAGSGASYTFTLQEADGRVVWTTSVTDTVVVLPDSVAVAPGATRFWFVDALLPDGQSRSTGVKRLMTRP